MSKLTDFSEALSDASWLTRYPDSDLREACAARGANSYLLGVKANIAVAGLACSAATPALAHSIAPADAPVVAALRRSGAVVAGATNMHELAFGVTSQNAAYGAVSVPGHPDRAAGGSSGGSAAAVASGEVPVALGTDTGGSISIPASLCGTAGFRPSTGRWPAAGIVGLSWTRDTPGVFAQRLETLSSLDEAVTGQQLQLSDRDEPRPRLGVSAGLTARLHRDTQRAWEHAVESLAGVVDFVEVDLEAVLTGVHRAVGDLMGWEAPRMLAAAAADAFRTDPRNALTELRAGVRSPDVQLILQEMDEAPVSAAAYGRAQSEVARVRAAYDAILRDNRVQALVFPATPAPAAMLDVGSTLTHLGCPTGVFDLYTRNTEHGTVIGAPMVTFPLPVALGALPIGLTVQGPRFGDVETLRLASVCARAVGSPSGMRGRASPLLS